MIDLLLLAMFPGFLLALLYAFTMAGREGGDRE